MFQPSLFDMAPHIRTVSDINAYLRQKFDTDLTLQDLWIAGEVSNWKQAASGHIYFTLKDAKSSIRCVVWRSQAQQLLYIPQRDGEALLAHGKISVYETGGNYQFYVDDLEPAGQGALYAQFENIKNQLEEEGLFDAELKKPLPEFPKTIGVVTSPDAAALRDILNVLRRRYPLALVILSPAQVQGDAAPPQIIRALKMLVKQPVDVIILSRGGGSIEDLWAFNNEAVARAVAGCSIPVVSGVGHETDFTIVDFVADVRAPTPSAAAELVSPDSFELKRILSGYQTTMVDQMQQRISNAKSQVQQQQWALQRLSPQAQINNHRQQIDGLVTGADRTVWHYLTLQQQRVENLTARLTTLNPLATLDRGYAIVQKGQSVVTGLNQVSQGDEISIKLKDGEFDATVSKT